MITDIPTSTDFQNTALNLLNLAWDSTVGLLSDRMNVEYPEVNERHPVSEIY